VKGDKPKKKILVGTVISDKMNKTVTVEVERRRRHPMYEKFMTKHIKIKAHDEKKIASCGDIVKVIETRPISKDKNWRVIEILTKAKRG